eukprot:9485199-Pyramimonas_sp.AAC.1
MSIVQTAAYTTHACVAANVDEHVHAYVRIGNTDRQGSPSTQYCLNTNSAAAVPWSAEECRGGGLTADECRVPRRVECRGVSRM